MDYYEKVIYINLLEKYISTYRSQQNKLSNVQNYELVKYTSTIYNSQLVDGQ